MSDTFNAAVVHYDEIGLKAGNFDFFIRALISNIKQQIAGAGGQLSKVKKADAKIIIEKINNDILQRLKFIPGIANFAPAIIGPTDIDEIKKSAVKIIQYYRPLTFKIETARSDKQFPRNSMEISREVGAYVLSRGNRAWQVDVNHPDLLIKIELAKNKTCVLGKKEQGIGGLPVSTAGKVVCLLSGGIDSPVAAFEMMKRGAEVVFVHFHNQTINKKGVEEKIKNIVRRLAKVQGLSLLYIVPFVELQKRVIAAIPADLRMIVYRRLMFDISARLAGREKAKALSTGDSLSQVASQTLDNLDVIYKATRMLKLAPLIGMNKREIIDIARKIGTYDYSIEPYADCCNLLIAKHPETRAKLDEVLVLEKNLNCGELIEQAINNSQKYELSAEW